MAYRGVWLIFSLLVFFCCGSLANRGEIKLDFKISNDFPISTITIGSNKYQLMLGTWYSNLWIFSKSACEDKKRKAKKLKDDSDVEANLAMCKKVTTYDDTKLSESDKIKKFEVPYLNGKLKGYLRQETIKIDGHNLQHSIGIVTDWSPEISTNNKNGCFDGHFGLMFRQEQESFFFKLLESKIISSKRFGIYFNRDHNSGELIFGGNDIDGGVESFKDVQIVSAKTGWLINIDSIKVGTQEVAKNIKAFVDLSSNAFFGKAEIISKINEAVGATKVSYQKYDSKTKETKEEFLFPIVCHTDSTLVMTINDNQYNMDGSAMVYTIFPNYCVSTFTISDLDMDYDLILGTRFLNKYYSVFDVEKQKISFAENKPKEESKSWMKSISGMMSVIGGVKGLVGSEKKT